VLDSAVRRASTSAETVAAAFVVLGAIIEHHGSKPRSGSSSPVDEDTTDAA
jgi:hypothetical protein